MSNTITTTICCLPKNDTASYMVFCAYIYAYNTLSSASSNLIIENFQYVHVYHYWSGKIILFYFFFDFVCITNYVCLSETNCEPSMSRRGRKGSITIYLRSNILFQSGCGWRHIHSGIKCLYLLTRVLKTYTYSIICCIRIHNNSETGDVYKTRKRGPENWRNRLPRCLYDGYKEV